MTSRRKRGLPPVLIMCELCDFAVRSDSWRPARRIIAAHRAEKHNAGKVLL